MEYPEEIKKLPVYPFLDEICDKLKNSKSHTLVLTAATAAGKSTAVPFSLLKNFQGNILMLEPRRVAAYNIADRISGLLNEDIGQTCGYCVHLENKTSANTRFTVMTDAVLTKRMQADAFLEGVNVVVIDEFHERSIHADLALSFLRDVMDVRDDLYLVIMSATLDTEQLQEYFKGTDGDVTVPLMEIPGRQFPVEIVYDCEHSVEKVVDNEVHLLESASKAGSILVFLPGIKEIKKTEILLKEKNPELNIQILHSSVSLSEQKKILSEECKNGIRIILSSSIAETSVTVKDVVCVVDSGYCRMNMFNLSTGMNRLETRRESEFNAAQRAGRAGRISSGKCVCLWGQNDPLVKSVPPEIMHSDLASVVLECYKWGAKEPEKLRWLDCPSIAAWNQAVEFLTLVGCLKDNKITALGEACLALGVGIRVACVALSGVFHNKLELSTEYALSNVIARFESGKALEKTGLYLKKRVQKYNSDTDLRLCFPQVFPQFSTTYALLCGYPDLLAKKLEDGTYQMATGRKAVLNVENAGSYIVVLDADAGNKSAVIYEYETIDCDIALCFMTARAENRQISEFCGDSCRLKVTEQTCFGKFILKEKKIDLTPEVYYKAVKNHIAVNGIKWLPLNAKCTSFLQRVQFYYENKGTDWQKIQEKYEKLMYSVDDWLYPFVSSRIDLDDNLVYDALYWYLDGSIIDVHVPEVLMLENGKKRKITYEIQNDKMIPVLEIIIQQAFGCFSTPKVMNRPVLMRLLSPARRPLQITSDLEGFWKNTWPEICSEMKGRYPKHNWDYRQICE